MKVTKESIKKYIQNMEQISVLSSPNFESDVNVDDYTKILHENFVMIGQLASENREILDTYVFPTLNGEELTGESKEILREAFLSLLDGYTMENVDIPLAVMISDRLLEEALKHSADTEQLIQALDDNVLANYNMMNVAKRTSGYSPLCQRNREKAFRSARMLLSYLEPEKFEQLSTDTAIDSVLTNARYISAMYENLCGDSAVNRENCEILRDAYAISESSYYRERVPDYDWNYYRLRTCEYFGMTLELHNKRGFEQQHCKLAKEYCDKLKALWNENPEENKEIISQEELCLLSGRADYLSGNLSVEEYKNILSELYKKRNRRSFSLDDIYINVLLPVEYIRLLANRRLSEEEKNTLEELYHNATNYVFQLPNQDILGVLLEYFCALLSNYIEIPGGMPFMELGLSCLAAFHPPTFVHTMMVGKIASCLCGHLLRLHPEAFAGVAGYDGKESLTEERRNEIIHFTYQGALCHDFGKLFVMDTPFVTELMEDEKVLADLEFILSQYREKMYRDTYVRLQKVSEREKR